MVDSVYMIGDNAHALYNGVVSNLEELDLYGNKTGRILSVDEICSKGLWHASSHIVLVTFDTKLVAQKRSVKTVTNPGKIEISAGGAVDIGETPLQAVVREVKEELGVVIAPKDVIQVGRQRWNSYAPSVQRYNRTFLHSFVGFLPRKVEQYRPQVSEVDNVFELTLYQASRLTKLHTLKKYSRLSSGYAYWTNAVKTAHAYATPEYHFVCRGNAFRSRIAESIMKKRGHKYVISSGIEARNNDNGIIAPMAANLTLRHGLNKYRKYTWTQTSQNLLNRSHRVIFMSPSVHRDAQQLFDLRRVDHEVWNIPDILDHTSPEAPARSEEIFKLIYQKVGQL